MLSNHCENCKQVFYQGFARCQNCGKLRQEFKDFAYLVVKTIGSCYFSGAPSDVKLPNGDYIWAADFFDYLKKDLISLNSNT